MASLLLVLHTFPAANPCLARHWPYFEAQEADETWIIGTTTGEIWTPNGVQMHRIAEDRYMDGKHLPQRFVDTLKEMLKTDHTHLMIAEYDTVMFNAIRWQAMEHSVASHRAGPERDFWYYHNPWLMMRETAQRFVEVGQQTIDRGVCPYHSPESSPDVFMGFVCKEMEQPIQDNLWRQYSRNSLDCAGHLDEAREAYRSGVDVIHGIKHESELAFILSP